LSADRTSLTLIKDNLPANGGRLDYNHENDTVLWAGAGEVREIDKSGTVRNSLTTPQGTGQAGHWSDVDKFVLAHRNNAYANELDWNGNELWSFGVYDTVGHDLTHLGGSVWDIQKVSGPLYVIADEFNQRILFVDSDGNVSRVVMYNQPRKVEQIPSPPMFLVTRGWDPRFPDMTAWIDGWHGRLRAIIPHHVGTDISYHPTKPFVYFNTMGGTIEFRLDAFQNRCLMSQELKPIDRESIAAGDTFTSRPMVVAPWNRIGVYGYGDQTYKIHIEKLRGEVHALRIDDTVDGDGIPNWDEFDVTGEFAANTLGSYMTEYPLHAIRVVVENTSASDGTFDAWVSLKTV